MLKISRLETPFQEIVFLLTMLGSLSVAIGGLFYLHLSQENFVMASGALGSSLISKGFNCFGYTYFFLVAFILHMGHLTLGISHSLKDVWRTSPIYLRSCVIYFSLLLLISSFLTILQVYNQWPTPSLLPYGHGGWFGYTLGGVLFRNFGLYGAMVILFSITSTIGILAGYMEIVHSFYVMKDIFQEILKKIKNHGPLMVKQWSHNVLNFIEQKPQFAHTGASTPWGTRTHSPIPSSPPLAYQGNMSSPSPWNQPGRLNTDHWHLPHNPYEEKPQAAQPTSSGAIDQPEEIREKRREEAMETGANLQPESLQGKREEDLKQALKEPQKQKDVDHKRSPEPKAEEVEIRAWTKRYKKLESSLLEPKEGRAKKSEQEMKAICQLLEDRLESFGVQGEIIKAHQGITLTMFEFMPAAGMKLSKIQSLSDDLALVIGAKSIRILTPIPGKTTVGIEVPNQEISTLRVSEMIPACIKNKEMALPVPLGLDVYNKPHINDLAKMPHLLVSGTTGSGKSVFMNSLISGLIFHKSPKELRFLMIDPKMIELSPYNGIPHLLKPVVTDVEEAKNLLLWAEKEMDKRYRIFSDMQAKNITSFNASVKKGSKRALEGRLNRKIDWRFEEMPFIVIVIDELADLMLTQRNEVERPITRIAQKARAAGIHMVVATQRPSSDIVTGLIKTNFPTRISFKVSSNVDSRTILDQPGAEKLLGNGDMLFMTQGKPIERLQGSFMTEEEVKKVVRSVKAQGTLTRKDQK